MSMCATMARLWLSVRVCTVQLYSMMELKLLLMDNLVKDILDMHTALYICAVAYVTVTVLEWLDLVMANAMLIHDGPVHGAGQRSAIYCMTTCTVDYGVKNERCAQRWAGALPGSPCARSWN